MLKQYPKFKRNEIEEYYKTLKKVSIETIKEYLQYRQARGVSSKRKLADIRRTIIQFHYIFQKDYNKIELKDLREYLALLNTSYLTQSTKNNIKIDLKNFLKFLFKDWNDRFSNLEDIRLNGGGRNEEKINSKTIFSKRDIENLMKHENKMFWKAFLMVQYEGGLRTIETRMLKWKDIDLNCEGDISEINIYATKTQKARSIFVKEATFYLNKLREEQENKGEKSDYVFHSIKNKDKLICKSNVNYWFKNLCMKALGREGWNYLLRHSRATELYTLAKQNKIAKDTAIAFMGHSEDMSNTYTHLDSKEVKKMLKEQVYKLEDLPEQEKNELRNEIKSIKTILKTLLIGGVKEIQLLDKTLNKKQLNEMPIEDIAELIIENDKKGSVGLRR